MGHRFDDVARRWTTDTDRRRVIQLTVVGLVALLRPRGDGGTASAQEAPASCSQVVNCVPGYVCCGNGACCPAEDTATCATDADCLDPTADPCVGARCDNGVCSPLVSVLCTPGFACCGNGVCCPIGGGCTTDADCLPWGAHPRVQGRCIGGACIPAGHVPA